MAYLDEIVKATFPLLGWEIEVGQSIIKLRLKNIEVVLAKIESNYYWLCRKMGSEMGSEVENIAGGKRKTQFETFQSMSRYVLGALKLYKNLSHEDYH